MQEKTEGDLTLANHRRLLVNLGTHIWEIDKNLTPGYADFNLDKSFYLDIQDNEVVHLDQLSERVIDKYELGIACSVLGSFQSKIFVLGEQTRCLDVEKAETNREAEGARVPVVRKTNISNERNCSHLRIDLNPHLLCFA